MVWKLRKYWKIRRFYWETESRKDTQRRKSQQAGNEEKSYVYQETGVFKRLNLQETGKDLSSLLSYDPSTDIQKGSNKPGTQQKLKYIPQAQKAAR